MKSYADFLKYELDNFEGDFDKFILYIPEFFNLLCDLLEEDIGIEYKRRINSALAYFVLPHDIIPEDVYGPMGYVDDVYVCAVVLNEIKEKYGIDILNKNWNHDEDIQKVLDVSYGESLKILNEQKLTERVLEASTLGGENG